MPSGSTIHGRTARGPGAVVRDGLRLIGRHWGILLLLIVGALLRAMAVYAYVPAFFFSDSLGYLQAASSRQPQLSRPWGYSGFLAVLRRVLSVQDVIVVQHVLGLLAVVLVYVLLRHRGVGRLVSCLAAAPLALDPYVIQIEHYVMAESLYIVLLVGALVILLWHERPPWWAAAAAGVLFGLGAITRTVGVVVLVVVALYLLARLARRRLSLLSAGAAALGVAAVLLPYVVWFHSYSGTYGVTAFTGHFLYGRVAGFADCDEVHLEARLRGLCPTQPLSERLVADWYVWDDSSPANTGDYSEQDLTDFSLAVIKAQPAAYLTSTAARTFHYFLPGHSIGRLDYCVGFWQFPVSPPREGDFCHARLAPWERWSGTTTPELRPAAARVLASYQAHAYTPGPVLGVLALVGLSGLLPRRWRGRRRAAGDAVLCVVLALTVIVVPSATAIFDYRYGLPVLALLPLGAALATVRREDDSMPGPAPEHAETGPIPDLTHEEVPGP